MSPRVAVVIPTFNEAENLPILLGRLTQVMGQRGIEFEVIIVDDDSPDHTWQVAQALQTDHPQLRVIRRTRGERGLAAAVVEGWRAARGELLAVMDADLQHPPELLPRLLAAFEEPSLDVVIASRYAPQGERLRWNPLRRWLSRGASNLAQAVLPPQAHDVTDPMSGYFVLRRRVLEGATLTPQGYKILLEVLSRGRCERVVEVPYQFGRRHRGHSKLGAQVMRDYLAQLWSLAWAPVGFGRFVRYCLVGLTGVAVNMGVLWWLRGSGILGTLRAGAVAIELSIMNNFLWNELWTFRDRSQLAPRLRSRAGRFVSFNVVCGFGALINEGFLWWLAVRHGWPYLLVNALAIGIVTLWNFGFNMTWTWMRLTATGRPAARAGEGALHASA